MNRHVVYGSPTVNTYERETDTFLESFFTAMCSLRGHHKGDMVSL